MVTVCPLFTISFTQSLEIMHLKEKATQERIDLLESQLKEAKKQQERLEDAENNFATQNPDNSIAFRWG